MTTPDEQPLNHRQLFNEALVRMSVLLYQIDGKVTLTEQDYFEELTEQLEWTSGTVLPAFISQVIHEARVAIDQNAAREYLRDLGNDLNIDPAKAFEVAMEITAADGKRSDEELELLSLLSNRVLAKGLVA
ncbi:TerB family tellurite resistance protein [Glaciecola sp. XM2]|jgi:tellurite resistance protein|uniref:TerB family tellurite resistance protein n=1 Tax=Glaciecola sp. XM2 TaxID=1914931 RepID=UPI001BDE2B60|nr:TerB family tellurite resistance protein [Glaciecola sp. XM2]MBT1452462.1 TerB family tellurite resistance protein [Glaciecola sp. XM2]